MNEASVPAIIARIPRRLRSPRRSGARPPMPPIWMAMLLKFAKPQSAYVAITMARADRSEPLCSMSARWR